MSVSAAALCVKEPVLQLLVCLRNDSSGGRLSDDDPRRVVAGQAARFAQAYAAKVEQLVDAHLGSHLAADRNWAAADVDELDKVLNDAHLLLADGRYLLNLTNKVEFLDGQRAGTCQARIYTSNDAFVVQLGVDFRGPWRGTLRDGFDLLSGVLTPAFAASWFTSSAGASYGASLVYWAMTDDARVPVDYANDASAIVGGDRNGQLDRVPRTSIDYGVLWHGEVAALSTMPHATQDTWVLVTRDLSDAQQQLLNRRFFAPEASHVRATINRLRFRSYQRELEADRSHLLGREKALDDAGHALMQTIDKFGSSSESAITQFRSAESRDFQTDVDSAANKLAWFRSHVSELKRLRRTLHLARRNYIIAAACVINESAEREIRESDSRESAAIRVLTRWRDSKDGGDECLLAEFGYMRELCDQLNADIEYSDDAIERNQAVLQSSTEQLQIAGQRELGEISHHISIDSAAVVASLAAFVAVEAVVKPLDLERSLLGLGLVLCVASVAFAILIWKSAGPRPFTPLVVGSAAVVAGLIITILAFAIFSPPIVGTVTTPGLDELRVVFVRFGSAVLASAATVLVGVAIARRLRR